MANTGGGPDLPDDLASALNAFKVWEPWQSLDSVEQMRVVAWVNESDPARVRRARRVAAILAAGLTPDGATLHRYERAYLRRHPEHRSANEPPVAATSEPVAQPERVAQPGRYGWEPELRHYRDLLPVLEAEWADEPSQQDGRRALIRLWAAGVIGQDVLHKRARGRSATIPVALSAESSLGAAWDEIDFAGQATQEWLRAAIGTGEHVISLMLGSNNSFWRMGCVVLTMTRVRFIPIHPSMRAWSIALDSVRGIDPAHRGIRDVTVAFDIEGYGQQERVQCSDEPLVGWRLAFRARHAIRWRTMGASLRERLRTDLDLCATNDLLDASAVAMATRILTR